jgi:hypothetical protein
MADKTSNANSPARIAAATTLNALRPVLHFQSSILRMWANSIDRFAGNYEKGLAETTAKVEKQSSKDRAA